MIELTDREHTGEINEAVAATALADATAEIDAYLGRFKRPFDEVPPILTRLCCDIARYRLSASGLAGITDEIRNRYKTEVLDLLRALAKGDVQLGMDAAGEDVATVDNAVLFVNGNNRIFARDQQN